MTKIITPPSAATPYLDSPAILNILLILPLGLLPLPGLPLLSVLITLNENPSFKTSS